MWPYFILYPRSAKNARIASRCLRYLAKLTDMKWELRNGDILTEDRAAIIVSNHQSALDILGMFVVWDVANKMTAIAKKELFYVPLIGITFYLCGIVFIDRKNGKNAYKQLKITTEMLKKYKTKLWVYPEGTRNSNLSTLLPFKKGAFAAAVDAQLPIIPIVISPYHFFTKGKEALILKGPIVIECLTPEPTVGLLPDDVPALTERIRARMDAKYKQLSEEILDYANVEFDKKFSSRLEIK
ncbi:1-acyl-sn-glycerol-3-phosphate acyltransferase alpha-like [Epargyreus clarus]|uniref:1-acyl-sn-glycerol-3-phosphate acyltransferase alpha-like n=1 Tax=Epargyreus clarus TaxID=520877 RepID=UPI003C2FCAB7